MMENQIQKKMETGLLKGMITNIMVLRSSYHYSMRYLKYISKSHWTFSRPPQYQDTEDLTAAQ